MAESSVKDVDLVKSLLADAIKGLIVFAIVAALLLMMVGMLAPLG